MNYSHSLYATKSNAYENGRPDYPESFFTWLYEHLALDQNMVIADMGAGTGMIARHFLERKNEVYCIEPDTDMLAIADQKFQALPAYHSVLSAVEDCQLSAKSIDLIFCGNSYHWFSRPITVPYFRKIIAPGGNIVITNCGPAPHPIMDESWKLFQKYKTEASRKSSRSTNANPPFKTGTFEEHLFEFTFSETLDTYMAGTLSASFSPPAGSPQYEPFCQEQKVLFHQYSTDGIWEAPFQIRCLIGKPADLIPEQ